MSTRYMPARADSIEAVGCPRFHSLARHHEGAYHQSTDARRPVRSERLRARAAGGEALPRPRDADGEGGTMRARGTLAITVVALIAALATACAPAQPAQSKPGGPVVATIARPGVMVESLNPYAHSTTQIYPTWKHVIEPLVEWDWTKKDLVPVLAESWSNPENRTWLFKLKQGVRFHDGSESTAEDVVHSYTRILKDPDSKQASSINGIDDMEVLDRYTVSLHTKTPDAALLFRLSQRFITSKALYDRLGPAEADKLAIGTGPYKFKEWVPGQRFVLEKNPDYTQGLHPPTVDQVVFRNIPESEAA